MPRTRINACAGKERHTSKASAKRHRDRLIRIGTSPVNLRIYPCPYCGGLHVGRRRTGKR